MKQAAKVLIKIAFATIIGLSVIGAGFPFADIVVDYGDGAMDCQVAGT